MSTQQNDKLSLWELLVPANRNHKGFDEHISNCYTGSTIYPTILGYWKGEREQSVPVRIACTDEQILEIIDFTKKYYLQEAIIAYKISSKVIIR
jgi:hypothetical protein